MRALGWAALCGLGLALLACETRPDSRRIADCPALEELPPLAGAEACSGPQLSGFRARLAAPVEEVAGPLRVRVSFGDPAEIAQICVDPSSAPGAWRARSRLGERLDSLLATGPVPACLAVTRLDLNRYEAKLEEIRIVERNCRSSAGISDRSSARPTSEALRREFQKCIDARSDWLLLYPYGRQEALVFSQPEDPTAERLSQSWTARRCEFPSRGLEWQIQCIQEDGWELLGPDEP